MIVTKFLFVVMFLMANGETNQSMVEVSSPQECRFLTDATEKAVKEDSSIIDYRIICAGMKLDPNAKGQPS